MRVEIFKRHEPFAAHRAIPDRRFGRWSEFMIPRVTFEADALLVSSYKGGAPELFVLHWYILPFCPRFSVCGHV
jgi:hypothetical protein